MIYFLETKLNEKKPVFVVLKNIYGIGINQSIFFCKQLGISKNYKLKNLSKFQLKKLNFFIKISKLKINVDLIKQKRNFLKLLIDIKCYKGIRKTKGFPVRGQRTRSNSKTAKKLNKFF